MDEPLSNLDSKLRVQMRMEIIKLHKSLGVTFIYVTHDQIEAMTMADRIVVMKDGLIQQVDTPEAVYDTPNNTFVASFIGSPQINLLIGQIQQNAQGSLEFHTNRFVLPIPVHMTQILIKHNRVGHSITLGIRPEHINLEELYSDTLITGIYKLSELMGADRYLYMDIGQRNLLIVRVSAQFRCHENDRVKIAPDMTKALFFHPDNGVRFQ
jgi:multiple sugar transport system ATP-binding protein